MEIKIDQELRALIPPLSQEEYKQLEENIIQFGCLDSLKVWAIAGSDEGILLDGHNRFAICSDHNVSYDTESVALIDRAAAIDWMISNQLGRRNLSAEQVGYLRGKQYQQEKQEITNPDGSNQYKEVVGHFDPQPSKSTAAKLAKEHGVSERTIKRDADYAKAIDAIVAATAPEVQQQILATDSKFTKSAILKLAKLAQQEPGVVMELIKEVHQAPSKTAASAIVRKFILINDPRTAQKKVSLSDFETIDAALDWLLQKFTASEVAEWAAQNSTEV